MRYYAGMSQPLPYRRLIELLDHLDNPAATALEFGEGLRDLEESIAAYERDVRLFAQPPSNCGEDRTPYWRALHCFKRAARRIRWAGFRASSEHVERARRVAEQACHHLWTLRQRAAND